MTSPAISPADFASLLCSRLCHDLLSPVGALNNGLELLADETDPAMRARCLELLNDSARASANKLKFFRLAFGAAGGYADAIDTRDAQVAIEGLLGENRRLTLNWMVEEASLPKVAVKALLNLAMIAGDALVRGGTLDIGGESLGDATEIVLRAAGERLVLDEAIRGVLVDGAAGGEITPRTAAAFLVHQIITEAGGSVQVGSITDGVLLIGATVRAG